VTPGVSLLMKNQMKNKNPFLLAVIIVAFVITSLFYLSFSHTINTTRGLIDSPDWLTLARIFLYLFAVCCFASVFLFEKYIIRKSTHKLIKQIKDPDLLITGLALFLSPASLAFFLFLFGGLSTDIYICSVLSFIGIIFWSWHKRAVFKINGKRESQTISSEIRLYTIILILLGLISLGFLTVKIFLIVKSPVYYTAPVSIDILFIPIYAFITLGSWGTAILRFRKSTYALFATEAISIILLIWFPFGTASFIYWIGWIRKKEKHNSTLPTDS
jgi:hypothetical protein